MKPTEDKDKDNDKEILDYAEKINDGIEINGVKINSDISESNQIYQALEKINQVSEKIRQHGTINKVMMNPGDQWAHLKIIEKIGQGGIGEVYRAFDPMLNCDVAVKFLNKKSQLYISQSQFLAEARNMAMVRHPHVLAVHGATVDNELAGYWSDYLDGIVLNEQLQIKPLVWKEQLRYAKELCQAVKQIHKNKLVHGDIKALNVMLQPQRGAILLDFGSSRTIEKGGVNQAMMQASPMAMAPEQFLGEAASSASDVYALGLLFWQMTTGKHPFNATDLKSLQNQSIQLKNHTGALKGTKHWQQLILKMVASKPANRPSIQQVDKALIEITEKPFKRAKTLVYAVLLLSAFGIAGISFYSNNKTKRAHVETEAVNNILTDILMTSSPLNKGKDVLLVDVLTDAQKALMSNEEISQRQKIKRLLQLLQTFRIHSNREQALNLTTELLTHFELTDSEKIDVLMQKGDMLNRNRKFDESESLFLEALTIKPNDKNDAGVLVIVHTYLIKNYIETVKLEKIPALLTEAKKLWEESHKKQSNLGLIYGIEGNYYESLKQYDKAVESYRKSHSIAEEQHGRKNINVLISKGNIAALLSKKSETLIQSVQLQEELVLEMNEFLGPVHTSTLIARANLASAYTQVNQPDKAIETLVPFMPNVYESFGEEGGTTLAFENIVAELYFAASDLDKADEYYQKIVTVHSKKHGAESALTLNAMLRRVLFLQGSSQVQLAQKMLIEMSEIANQAHDNNNRISLDIKDSLIWNEYLLGDVTSLEKIQVLVDAKITALGEKDPSTMNAMYRLEKIRSGNKATRYPPK